MVAKFERSSEFVSALAKYNNDPHEHAKLGPRIDKHIKSFGDALPDKLLQHAEDIATFNMLYSAQTTESASVGAGRSVSRRARKEGKESKASVNDNSDDAASEVASRAQVKSKKTDKQKASDAADAPKSRTKSKEKEAEKEPKTRKNDKKPKADDTQKAAEPAQGEGNQVQRALKWAKAHWDADTMFVKSVSEGSYKWAVENQEHLKAFGIGFAAYQISSLFMSYLPVLHYLAQPVGLIAGTYAAGESSRISF